MKSTLDKERAGVAGEDDDDDAGVDECHVGRKDDASLGDDDDEIVIERIGEIAAKALKEKVRRSQDLNKIS